MYNYGYLKSDVETFNKLWKSTNESKREELLKDRRLAITQMESNFASEMRAWFKLKKMSRSDELAEMKRNRQEAIVQRLENMGWGKELNLVRESRANTEFMAIIGAKEAKELTERGWKRMEAPLIKFFEDFRHARHLEAYRRNMYERFRTVADICPILAKPFEGIFPVPCQFALLPQVRDIVDLPTGPKLTSASFDSLKSDIASMVAAWKAAETARLIEEINSAMSMKLPLNADLGSLAIGTFHRCADYSCRNYLTYPAVLSKGYSSNTEAADSSDDYATVSHAILSGHGTRHRYEAWVYKAMQHIIEASGRSLLSTSAEEMDSLAIRLVCSTEGCKSDDHFRGVLSVYTWRSALEHARLNAGAEHRFTLAAEDLPLTKVQDLESVLSLRAAAALESAYGWKCKHCKGDRLHDDTDKKETMLKHVKAKHDIEQPGPTDIYLSPSCETLGFSMSPVHLLSRELTPKNILDLPNSIKTAVSLGTGDTRPL
ncbi:hypothetical protein EUX98_g7775 [Antrodiella citrinella]|uniref:Uncharacterized protein n=1 Tax=Antrodiella citrinella TaxID=2447956 RepID=A0A4S4MN16_9APHY|nr:hypothetical protein EUX98_g7775 [Antrodiella citrinella]